MKLLFIPIACFVFWFGGTPFEVIDATKKDWAGGRRETGYGTTYKIQLLSKANSGKLVIDQLWAGGEYFEVSARKWTDDGWKTDYNKNDTITVQAQSIKGRKFSEKKIIKDMPFSYSGEVLIGYKYKGKRKYHRIEKLKKLDKEYYP